MLVLEFLPSIYKCVNNIYLYQSVASERVVTEAHLKHNSFINCCFFLE